MLLLYSCLALTGVFLNIATQPAREGVPPSTHKALCHCYLAQSAVNNLIGSNVKDTGFIPSPHKICFWKGLPLSDSFQRALYHMDSSNTFRKHSIKQCSLMKMLLFFFFYNWSADLTCRRCGRHVWRAGTSSGCRCTRGTPGGIAAQTSHSLPSGCHCECSCKAEKVGLLSRKR